MARLNSVRVLISLAVFHDWPLFQLDVKNAFLYGDLQEEVYREQPPGFVAQGESSFVCKLKKAIYGLKQSPKAWYDKLSGVLLALEFKRDTSLVLKYQEEEMVWYYLKESILKICCSKQGC